MKAFTAEQIGNIFKIERFLTLTPMFYKGQEYQLQFDFKDDSYNTMNVIKVRKECRSKKVVGYFKIK